jgi:hypothetical protein
VVAECLRPSTTVCWGGATRRVVLINDVELTAPARGQVVAATSRWDCAGCSAGFLNLDGRRFSGAEPGKKKSA